MGVEGYEKAQSVEKGEMVRNNQGTAGRSSKEVLLPEVLTRIFSNQVPGTIKL